MIPRPNWFVAFRLFLAWLSLFVRLNLSQLLVVAFLTLPVWVLILAWLVCR